MQLNTIHSEEKFKGRVFNVRQDQIELPNGKLARVDIVEHGDSVTIVPIDDKGRVWFVRQYRHPTGGEILELPAGVIDPGEEPEECALREVREEIGMSAGQIRKVGEFYLAPGYSTEYMHVFLAKDLQEDPLDPDEDELISIEKIPLEDTYPMIHSGQIVDAKTIAALVLISPLIGPGKQETR
jgi:ADP-ribose pyrophosphatase